jgi:hypothetical protein
LTYGDAAELGDLTAAFARDGLAGGLKVVWVSDLTVAQATAELAQRVRLGRSAEGVHA